MNPKVALSFAPKYGQFLENHVAMGKAIHRQSCQKGVGETSAVMKSDATTVLQVWQEGAAGQVPKECRKRASVLLCTAVPTAKGSVPGVAARSGAQCRSVPSHMSLTVVLLGP